MQPVKSATTLPWRYIELSEMSYCRESGCPKANETCTNQSTRGGESLVQVSRLKGIQITSERNMYVVQSAEWMDG